MPALTCMSENQVKSMNDSQPIVPWLRHLSQIIPPSGMVLVGAGRGTSEWVEFLSGLPDTMSVLVEADSVNYKFLESMAPGHPSWRFYNEVISKEAGEIDFYETSISSENSLIDPDYLRGFWPNLTAHQITPRQAIALDGLLVDVEASWLFIDCLPALPIIEGADACLGGIDVIVARVVLPATDERLHSASLQALQGSLEAQGFRLQAVEPSRHPALGHALFIRTDCFGNEGARKPLLHAEERIESLLEELARAEQQIEALTNEKSQAEQEAAERRIQLESLEKSNLELKERQQQMDEEIAHAKQQIEALTNEKSQARKEAAERLPELHALRRTNAELMERQKRMDEEITKAKIQIELLEKLFFREPEK